MSSPAAATKTLEYKGRPLRRRDSLIYYGSMSDKYIIQMQVTDTRRVEDLDVPSRVSVQLQLTDADVRSRDRVVKETEKSGLYEAVDVGVVWLERALAGKLR
ncbi:MAG: hypothetical protein LBH17_00480 [Oscillospiraceae bacterium]|jgi:hypothetical protein|nr:hypothetical protein [Oscillospiraceae bacterium]